MLVGNRGPLNARRKRRCWHTPCNERLTTVPQTGDLLVTGEDVTPQGFGFEPRSNDRRGGEDRRNGSDRRAAGDRRMAERRQMVIEVTVDRRVADRRVMVRRSGEHRRSGETRRIIADRRRRPYLMASSPSAPGFQAR